MPRDDLETALRRDHGPFRPLAARLMRPLAIAVLILVVTACVGGLYGVERVRGRIDHEAHMLAVAIGYAAETLDSDADLQRFVGSMGAETGVSGIVVVGGSPSRVLASTEHRLIGRSIERLPDPDMRVNLAESLHTANETCTRQAETGLVTRTLPVVISRHDEPMLGGAVLVQIDAGTLRSEAAAWAGGMALLLVAAPTAIILLAWMMFRRSVLAPVNAMIEAVQEGGEFARIPITSHDEIGVLAGAINRAHREAAASAMELADSREEAEGAVREIAALRRALDEHLILSIADKSGKMIDANKGFCRIAGFSREELLGNDHRILNSGHHPKSFWVGVWKTISTGQAWRGEVCNRNKDGSIYWVDSTIVPYQNARGEIERFVSIRFDITAQKAAEEALVAAQEKAEAISKSKSEFLANMSHEIRTPMTAILGFTDLLKQAYERTPGNVEYTDYVETIQRNGEHLLALINDVLDVSKIEAGGITLETMDVCPGEILDEVRNLMLVKSDAKGIELVTSLDDNVPVSVLTDPARLRQILMNLVGNAIKFTELGGVRIYCDYERTGSGSLRFEVVDTGIGMSDEQAARLFGAFVQGDNSTSRRYGGTGLGLHISQRLTDILGGTISVESAHGIGSTFRFSISAPETNQSADHATAAVTAGRLCRSRMPALTDTDTDAGAPALAGLRILLAEDGPDNVRLIKHFLSAAGADVTVVENGRLLVEALTEDGSLNGRFNDRAETDVILTDIQMPEMDGYESTRRLRTMGCRLPIIALTAHAMEGDEDRCLRAGCDGYASKPLDWDRLIGLCADAASGRLRRREPPSAAA